MMRKSLIAFTSTMLRGLFFAAFTLAFPAHAQLQAWSWDDGTVPFVVSPMEIVERMLRMAEVGPRDSVIDLGSGDGRIVIAAAKRGAHRSRRRPRPEPGQAGDRECAQGRRLRPGALRGSRHLRDRSLGASVITLYLLPEFNVKLLPKLLRLKPGTRIVSHDGGIGAWPPDEKLEMRTPEKTVGLGGLSKVELWIVPADAAGRWTSDLGAHGGRWRFQVAQEFQVLDVERPAEGRDLLVRASRLRGDEIKLVVTGLIAGHAWHHLFAAASQAIASPAS